MSEKMPRINGLQLIKLLERLGFELQRQRGSHAQLYRAADQCNVTVPVHGAKELPPGTLRAILRDADISLVDFRKLLGK